MAESYSQYCPISRTLDLVGDRWSLLILRDLYVGTSTFNGLARGLPGLSRSLLAKRLRSFEREGLVEGRKGAGTFVLRRPNGPRPGDQARLARSLRQWVGRARAAGLEDRAIESMLRAELLADDVEDTA